MDEDLTILWKQAGPFAIQVDEHGLAWHAGAVRDVFALDADRVIVATDTGGVWEARSVGFARPLADLDKPDLWCVGWDPSYKDHFYVGGSGSAFYETDRSTPSPLLNWREVPPPEVTVTSRFGFDSFPVRTIYRIEILPETRRIVVATSDGVFWSPLPVPPPPAGPGGCLRTLLGIPTRPGPALSPRFYRYRWKQAVGLPNVPLGYLGLAVGPYTREPERIVAVASWGTAAMRSQPARAATFYWGAWENEELVMHEARVTNDFARLGARATTMACSEFGDHMRMYAISADDQGRPHMMFRSDDGGRVWNPFIPKVVGHSTRSFKSALGEQGNDWGRPCNCIAVSFADPNVFVVGWQFPGFFFSTDAGGTIRPSSSQHMHADAHVLHFERSDPKGHRVVVGSDGGVVMAPDLGVDERSHVSMFNRSLLNLQFEGAPTRQFWGSISASARENNLFAGGLQDNGLAVNPNPALEPWREPSGGDGQLALFLPTGHLLYYWVDDPAAGVHRARWDASSRTLRDEELVPVTMQDPQITLPKGLTAPVAGPVSAPRRQNARGQFMYAVAGRGEALYGYFSDPNGADPHWEFLRRVPISSADGYYISAVGSFDGTSILAGSAGGRLFLYDLDFGTVRELPVPPRRTADEEANASFSHIAFMHDRLAFATYNRLSQGFVLRVRRIIVEQLSALPVTTFYGLEVVRGFERDALFVAADNNVYESRDRDDALGDTWVLASRGLPKRPHCADLFFVVQPDGARWLYLSTYGRSAWRTGL